jgi:RNA polymerase sigma-70 factor (TIGR02960 family)
MAVSSTIDVSLDELERHRRELTGYCYRMLGSGFEAEDAAQESIVRAWKSADRFEGRSSVRSWLYRIATNVCLDQLRSDKRRARPMEMGPLRQPSDFKGDLLPEGSWVTPVADSAVVPDDGDPAEIAAQRETIRLAFVAALQHLPARQRAVFILLDTEAIPPTAQTIELENILRDDEPRPSLSREDVLRNAARTEDGFIVVPPILPGAEAG